MGTIDHGVHHIAERIFTDLVNNPAVRLTVEQSIREILPNYNLPVADKSSSASVFDDNSENTNVDKNAWLNSFFGSVFGPIQRVIGPLFSFLQDKFSSLFNRHPAKGDGPDKTGNQEEITEETVLTAVGLAISAVSAFFVVKIAASYIGYFEYNPAVFAQYFKPSSLYANRGYVY